MIKKKGLKETLNNKERDLFENRTLLVDLANLILDYGGLGNYFNLITKVSKYNPKDIYFIADASLKYKLSPDDVEIYLDLVGQGLIRPVPYGTPADLWLIQMALRIPESSILTNDAFRDFSAEFVNNCSIVRFYIIADDIYFNIDLSFNNNDKYSPSKIEEPAIEQPETKTPEAFKDPMKETEQEWLNNLYGSENQIDNKKIEIY